MQKIKSVDDHFKPIQTLFLWAGYTMFALAGLAILFAGAWWAFYHWKTLVFVCGGTMLWLACYFWWHRKDT